MDSFPHAFGALAIMAAAYVPLALCRIRNAHWIAMAAAVGFYWGREKRDHENRSGQPAAEVIFSGLLPWDYTAKGQADFAWPLGACLAAAVLVEAVQRRRPRGIDTTAPNRTPSQL
jgi:hypothetical protein